MCRILGFIYDWCEERLEIQSIADDILAKFVPRHVFSTTEREKQRDFLCAEIKTKRNIGQIHLYPKQVSYINLQLGF